MTQKNNTPTFRKKIADKIVRKLSNRDFQNNSLFYRELLANMNKFSTGIFGKTIFDITNSQNSIDKGYMINPYVYFCVNLIASAMSNAEWELFNIKDKEAFKEYKRLMNKNDISVRTIFKAEKAKSKGLEKVEQHSILDLLSQPNPNQGGTEFLRELIGFKYTTGNGYMTGYAPDTGINKGLYKQLFIMPSQFMKINTGGWSRPILNYELEMDGNKIIRPAEDVLHTKFWNPNYSNGQFLYGLSPVEAGNRPIEISNSAFETRKYSYENMGAYGVLHGGAAGSLKQDEAKLLDDSYLEKFGGNKKANRIMIAAAFLQWTQFGMSPVDLDIIKSNGLDKSDIGLLYNIRIELMNNTESTTYDNVLQAKKSLYTETVIPAARDLADELNRWLVKRYNDIQKTNLVLIPSFRDVPVLQDDYEKLHKMVLDDVKNAILSRNEGRKILGRDEVADVPNMNAYTLPRNYIDISNMEGLVDNTEVEVVVEEGKEK